MIQYMMILLDNRRRDMSERGASAVEYGLLIAGIAALVIVGVLLLGPTVAAAFTDTNTSIEGMTATRGTRIVG